MSPLDDVLRVSPTDAVRTISNECTSSAMMLAIRPIEVYNLTGRWSSDHARRHAALVMFGKDGLLRGNASTLAIRTSI